MPATIGHVLTATTPDNTSYEIRPSHWNSSHAVSLALTGSEIIGAFSNANNVSFGTNTAGAVTASASYLTGIGISGGTQSSQLSQVIFSNANGLNFGLSNGTITGSYSQSTITTNGLLSAIGLTASGSTGPATGLFFSNVNGVTFGNVNGTITASVANASQSSLVYSNANNVSFGTNGSTLTASFSQSLQTNFQQAVSALGNTSGVQTVISSGTLYLAGGNNLTISQNGQTLLFSGANVGGAQTGISAMSAGTTSVSSGTVYFSNANGVSFGFNGQTLTASIPSIGGAQTGISGVVVSNTTYTSGTVSFVNANGISFGSSGANGISASYTVPTFVQSNQTIGFYASSNTVFNSSLTIDARNVTFLASGDMSIGFSNSSIILSVPYGDFDSLGVSNIGNTAGQTGMLANSVVLAGTNNITLNQSTGGGGVGTIYISGPPYQGLGVLVSNTTITSGTISFQNANGISFGSSGANGITASYTVPSLANLITGISLSAGTTSSGVAALSFGNANAVSFGFSNGSITASIPSIGGAQTGISGIGVSNNTYTSGTVIFQNANGISFGSSGANGISVSYTVPTQSIQPVAVSGSNGSFAFSTLSLGNSNGFSFYTTNGSVVGSYTTPAGGGIAAAAGTQTGGTGTVNFANSNNITFGMSGSSQITASFSTSQSVQPVAASASNASFTFNTLSFGNANGASFLGTNGSIGLSYTVPSTAGLLSAINVSGGTTSSNLSAVVFSNSNNISFGLSGSTITGSAAAQTAQTLGVYGLGNQVGTSSSTVDARSLTIDVSGAGLSVGWSNGSLLFNANPYVSAIGVSTSGNTLGNTGTVSNQYVFAGINNITLSQITGAGGATMVISGPSVAGAQTGISGVSVGGTNYTSGTVNLINSNGFSWLSTTGQGVVASYTVPSQSNQSLGLFVTGNTSYSSSGTVDARFVTVSGSGLITVGYSNGSLIIGDSGSQSNQTLGVYAFSNQTGTTSSTYDARSLNFAGAGNISVGNSNGSVIVAYSRTINSAAVGSLGNTAGMTGYSTTNSVLYVGSGNITLSQSYSSNSATISFIGAGGVNAAAGTQTQSSGTLSFSNANGISFGLSASSILTASYTVPTQTTQPVAVQGSNGSYAFSTLTFGNLNGMSFYTSNSSIVGSYTNDVNPVLAAGTQTGTSASTGGTILFSNSNNVSFGMSGSSVITASASQSLQTFGFTASSNTVSGSTGTLSAFNFVGLGNVSVGFSNSSVLISGSGGAGGGAAISAGTQSASSGTVVFSNSNNISFGLSNSSVLTASYSQSNQTLNAFMFGNTTGSSSGTFDARSMSLAGSGALTFGFSNSSILMQVPATSSISVTGGLSLSISSNTISLGVPALGTQNFYNPMLPGYSITPVSLSAFSPGIQYFYPMQLPNYLNVSQAMLLANIYLASATNTTYSYVISNYIGVYSRNVSTLSLVASGSASFGVSLSGSTGYVSYVGLRALSIPLAASLTPGDYWIGFLQRNTYTTTNPVSFSYFAGSCPSIVGVQSFGATTYTSTSQMQLGFGFYSTTGNSLSASVAFSNLTGAGYYIGSQQYPIAVTLNNATA